MDPTPGPSFLLRTRVLQLGKCMSFRKNNLNQNLSKDTSRRHLLAEMVLVLANRSVPPCDCLVLANHDILGNLVEETGNS